MRVKVLTTLVAVVASVFLGSASLGQAHCKERRSVDGVDSVTIIPCATRRG